MRMETKIKQAEVFKWGPVNEHFVSKYFYVIKYLASLC